MMTDVKHSDHAQEGTDYRIRNEQLFYGELAHGKGKIGGPKMRFKDSLKAHLKQFSINTEFWEGSTCC